MTERPWPLQPGRILVDAIKDTRVAQIAVGCRKSAIDLLRAQCSKHGEKWMPVRAHAPIAIHHLVENAGQRPIACNELLQSRFLLINIVGFGGHGGMIFNSNAADRASSDTQDSIRPAARRSIRRYGRDPGNERAAALPPRKS